MALSSMLSTPTLDGILTNISASWTEITLFAFALLLRLIFTHVIPHSKKAPHKRKTPKDVEPAFQPADSALQRVAESEEFSLLRAALQCEDVPEIVHCCESVASLHQGGIEKVAPQIIKLACEERAQLALQLVERDGPVPFTTEVYNVMLEQFSRKGKEELVHRVERYATECGTRKDGRTYAHLLRCAKEDKIRVKSLGEEMAANGVECTKDAARVVLEACWSAENCSLVDKLYAQLRLTKDTPNPATTVFIRFYAEYNQHKKVIEIFDTHMKGCADMVTLRRMLSGSRSDWCLVLSALHCNRKEVAKSILGAMPDDTASHVSMIRCCASNGNLDHALQVFELLESVDAPMPFHVWNSVLDACVRCGNLKKAMEQKRKMQKAGMLDDVSYNIIIKGYLRAGNRYNEALAFKDEMMKAGFAPNIVTFNEFIDELSRHSKSYASSGVWELVEEMERCGVRPTAFTCSLLLKNIKATSPHADLVKSMEVTNSIVDAVDEVLLSSIVEACVRARKGPFLSQQLEKISLKGGIEITGSQAYGSLIKGYGYVHNVEAVWKCWRELHAKNIQPTHVTIGCMIEALVNCGEVDRAYDVVSELLDNESTTRKINSVSFGSMLKGFTRAKRFDRVWATFDNMLARNIEPSVFTFNTLIDACAMSGQMDRVPAYLEQLERCGFEPNHITYNTLIKGHVLKGDMAAAFGIKHDIQKDKNIRPDEVLYSTLLSGCAQAGMVEEAEELFAQMKADGYKPNTYDLTCLVKIMGRAQRLDRAFEIIASVVKYDVKANKYVFGVLCEACITAKDMERAAMVFDWAMRENVQLGGRTYQLLVRSLISSGKYAETTRVLLDIVKSYPCGASHQPVDDAFLAEAIASMSANGGAAVGSILPKMLQELLPLRPGLERLLIGDEAPAAGGARFRQGRAMAVC